MSAIGNVLSIINLLPVRPLIVDPSASAFDAHLDHRVFSTQGLYREHTCTTCNVIYVCVSPLFCTDIQAVVLGVFLCIYMYMSVINTHGLVL